MPVRDVEVFGLRLNLIDEGQGEPVLLLHGFPDSKAVWRFQIPALVAAGYRVIAPDLRGFGDSARPEGKDAYKVERLVGDIMGLLDALEIPAAHIVGHDWGAGVAWSFAIALPARVLSLAVLSVGHPLAMRAAGVEQREKSWYFLLFQFDRAEDMLSARHWALFKDLTRHHPEAIRAISAMEKPGALTAAINLYRANLNPDDRATDIPDALPAVAARTLGVWSNGDVFLTETQMLRSGEHVAGPWRYVRVDGASHWLQIDQPDLINALLLDWLKDTAPSTR